MLTVKLTTSTDALANSTNPYSQKPKELDEKDKAELERLKQRDKEVRNHEEAHKRAAAGLLSVGPTYEYKVGPDGKKYAVSGDVQIDIAEVKGNPEATLKKAQQIKRAALAPEEPSVQDKKIATKATEMELKAKRELNNVDSDDNNILAEMTAELKTELKDIITYDSKGNVITDAELNSADVDVFV
ncbi:MAG TPA: putative metalloprotease CJM1_0395 family protein [Melioribacteraceae bacterium]|nr:putative metalloprotease CJM1_0395 family protein [Melioribacteraceae bacterium]